MKFAVAALLATASAQTMSAEDTTKCTDQITEYERLGAGAIFKIEAAWVEEGLGGPDLIAIENGTCWKDGIAAWEKIKTDSLKAADFAKCKELLDTGKDTAACFVKAEKAVTGGGCKNTGTAEAPVRRVCAAATECCGGMRLEEADTTNYAEFCYDSTKTEIVGADTAANFVNTWFIKDFFLKGAKATVTAAATKDAWATYQVADTAKAREEAFAAEMGKAAKAKAVFGCIEGAGNLAASAAALLAASYVMA